MVGKQVLFTAAIAAASVSAVVSISDVFASSDALPGPGVIRLTATVTSRVRIDSGHQGRSIGDVEVTRQRLFYRRTQPKPLGRSELVCTFTGGRSANCNATYFLPRGKIVVSGTRPFQEIFELAVVGGTGHYDNVRGTLTVTSLGGKPARYFLYFRLLV